MSNEPVSKRLLAQESPVTHESPADPHAAAGGDTTRMLAALERMEAALRERTNALDLMRADLRDASKTIVKAWESLDAEGRLDNASTLLHGLEASIKRMMLFVEAVPEAPAALLLPAMPLAQPPRPRSLEEIAFVEAMADDPQSTAPIADEPPAATTTEPVDVPTVSGVVARLSRVAEAEASVAEQIRAGNAATAVARLEALVEELAASMPFVKPETPPAAEAAPPPSPPQPAAPRRQLDVPLPEPVLVARYRENERLAPPPLAVTLPGAVNPPPAATSLQVSRPVIPEIELLSNLQRMEAVPYLEPQAGNAMNFESSAEPTGARNPTHKSPAPPPAAPTSADVEIEALLFESQPEIDPDPAAALFEPLDAPDIPAAPVSAALEAPVPVVPEPPVDPPHVEERSEITWEFELPTPAALVRTAQPRPAQSEPKPQPASDLTWEIEPLAPASPALPPRTPEEKPASGRDDPLAPIKAMSDAERIAVFE